MTKKLDASILPAEVLREVADWRRERRSGTIELSYHQGQLKTMRSSQVVKLSGGSNTVRALQISDE